MEVFSSPSRFVMFWGDFSNYVLMILFFLPVEMLFKFANEFQGL